ncbi:MAG TPA: beta-propeller fold lactonase family protein, partial [Chthoniobacteraceae bacterium]
MKPRRLTVLFAFVISAANAVADQPDLAQVQTLSVPDLKGTSCITVTNDGRFAYANGGSAGTVLVLKRDPANGELAVVDTLKGPELNAPIRTRLSHDDKLLIVSDYRGDAVIIYSRDPATGRLTRLVNGSAGSTGAMGLKGVSDALLSADNHYLYTASTLGLTVFTFENNQLSVLQHLEASGELKGLRFTAMSPSGRWLYTVANEAGTLGVFHRDLSSGKLKRMESLSSGHDGVTSLRGAFRVAVSADARNVYVSAGRFNGDQAVTVFEVQADGHLKQVQ